VRYKIGETVYVKGKKAKIADYSEISHRYKVKLEKNQYIFLRDHDITKVDESWRK